MIHSIEVSNFRCLRQIQQRMDPFNILVGPNGSGKSAFMDAIAFLSDFLKMGLDAVGKRSANFYDLFWKGEGNRFDIAVEAAIPGELKGRLHHKRYYRDYEFCRYEVGIGLVNETGELGIRREAFWLRAEPPYKPLAELSCFLDVEGDAACLGAPAAGWLLAVHKMPKQGLDSFSAETCSYSGLFDLESGRSALGNLPPDESKFPVSVWFKKMLLKDIHRIEINPAQLRAPWLPSGERTVTALPWIVDELARKHPKSLAEWISHLQVVLPDLKGIASIDRPEDRHRYLMLEFANGTRLPSWVVSDGTLRMLALTVLAYIPGLQGIYLIEEPENGIHPRALHAVMDSLSSVYESQVFVATHSPIVLRLAKPENILCFSKDAEGATGIVRGTEHPKLRDWQGQPTFDVLFASGILG
jgi:predicted ATPase